ncbi:MAG: ATP-binding cassette domain-containing protein [Coriobacteriales bacterium]
MALVAAEASYTYAAGTQYASDALSDVTLSLEVGELVLVVGETGSGKSTLLRVLAGLLDPSSGSVTVDGLAPGDGAARGRTGLVFQNPESQFFAETVLDDVAFGPRNLGQSDPSYSAQQALRAVGLDPDVFGARSPFTLSGGEARRAAIAGVLAFEPRYLLLDEPTAGLDRPSRDAVLSVVKDARAQAGVLVVTHDPEQFLQDAQAVVVLFRGTQVFSGAPSGLLTDPGPYLKAGMQLPDVIRAQLVARERGAQLAEISFDPEEAARKLLQARRGAR